MGCLHELEVDTKSVLVTAVLTGEGADVEVSTKGGSSVLSERLLEAEAETNIRGLGGVSLSLEGDLGLERGQGVELLG